MWSRLLQALLHDRSPSPESSCSWIGYTARAMADPHRGASTDISAKTVIIGFGLLLLAGLMPAMLREVWRVPADPALIQDQRERKARADAEAAVAGERVNDQQNKTAAVLGQQQKQTVERPTTAPRSPERASPAWTQSDEIAWTVACGVTARIAGVDPDRLTSAERTAAKEMIEDCARLERRRAARPAR